MIISCYLLLGALLLFWGGNRLIDQAVLLAARLRLSKAVIGGTFIAFGTSIPELVVSLQAAYTNHPDLVLGNVIGSNIANILLVLSCVVLLQPLPVPAYLMRRDGCVLLAFTLGFVGMACMSTIGHLAGSLLLLSIAVFVYKNLQQQPSERSKVSDSTSTARLLGMFALSLMALLLGAQLLVIGSVALSQQFGIPESVIGITVVAVGSAAPEIAISALAAWRQEADIALSNIIGSNIFNLGAVTGLTATLVPLPVAQDFIQRDLWVLAGATLWLAAIGPLKRLWGGISLVVYLGYLAMLLV